MRPRTHRGGRTGAARSAQPLDTQTDYVRNFLRFIDNEDVRFVHAEGLNTGDEPRRAAHDEIRRLVHGEAVVTAA